MTNSSENTPQIIVVATAISEAAYEAVDGWLVGSFDTFGTARAVLAEEQPDWVEGEDFQLDQDEVRTLRSAAWDAIPAEG